MKTAMAFTVKKLGSERGHDTMTMIYDFLVCLNKLNLYLQAEGKIYILIVLNFWQIDYYCSLVESKCIAWSYFPAACKLCGYISNFSGYCGATTLVVDLIYFVILFNILIFQDEYSLIPQSYSMNIDGYVLVYSVTNSKR